MVVSHLELAWFSCPFQLQKILNEESALPSMLAWRGCLWGFLDSHSQDVPNRDANRRSETCKNKSRIEYISLNKEVKQGGLFAI
jgi:hypothetical protein